MTNEHNACQPSESKRRGCGAGLLALAVTPWVTRNRAALRQQLTSYLPSPPDRVGSPKSVVDLGTRVYAEQVEYSRDHIFGGKRSFNYVTGDSVGAANYTARCKAAACEERGIRPRPVIPTA